MDLLSNQIHFLPGVGVIMALNTPIYCLDDASLHRSNNRAFCKAMKLAESIVTCPVDSTERPYVSSTYKMLNVITMTRTQLRGGLSLSLSAQRHLYLKTAVSAVPRCREKRCNTTTRVWEMLRSRMNGSLWGHICWWQPWSN